MFNISALQKFLFILIISFILSFIECSDENIVSIRIRESVINGKIETVVDGKQLNVFRGIAYAEPPTGDLRFKKPLPVKQWPKRIDAFNYGNICHQNKEFLEILGFIGNKSLSEDCLYLNIFSPNDNKNTDILKPVMFWIHGGALYLGSSNVWGTPNEVFAAKGDVVLVSINYRLGTLGFLYSGTEEAPGNAGLWDQALALEWVNDNIRYFGGDPQQITIFGMSAGSWSVSLHVVSPISRNLYTNAIMMSGAVLNNYIDDKPEDTLNTWIKVAKLIGCEDRESENKFTTKLMNCLRDKDPEELTQMIEIPELKNGIFKWFTLVVVDGEFLPQKPSHMLSEGNFKQKINLMVSTAEDEGGFMLAMMYDMQKYGSNSPKNFTFNEAFDELKTISTELVNNSINGEEVAKLYFTGLSDSNDFDALRRTIGIAVGDYYLLCPTIEFAKQVFRNSEYKSNVYQYYFTKKDAESMFCAKWMGACHGVDAIPLSGTPFLDLNHFSDKDREVSKQLIGFITDFAKTGTPSPQMGAVWPKYYTIDDNIIAPYYEMTTEPKANTNFNIGLKINECEYLWRKYLI